MPQLICVYGGLEHILLVRRCSGRPSQHQPLRSPRAQARLLAGFGGFHSRPACSPNAPDLIPNHLLSLLVLAASSPSQLSGTSPSVLQRRETFRAPPGGSGPALPAPPLPAISFQRCPPPDTLSSSAELWCCGWHCSCHLVCHPWFLSFHPFLLSAQDVPYPERGLGHSQRLQ